MDSSMKRVDLSSFAPRKLHTEILPASLCEKFGAIVYDATDTHIIIVLAKDNEHSKQLLAHHFASQQALGKQLEFALESSFCFYWILKAVGFVEHFYLLDEVDSRLQYVLEQAIALHASDVHIEHKIHYASIRLRIDGILREIGRIELEDFSKLSSKIKLDSRLDITEMRLPQDGRMQKELAHTDYDFRISCMPLLYGESIVLRILHKHSACISLDTLGLSHNAKATLQNAIDKKSGLILVVGPTGSGKSTTLYALIEELQTLEKKIITIEDPIEYQIQAATQIQLNEDLGFSFYQALKSTLRQDPDIILVGEIRDKQTLELALNASLTGHLVLASLHSPDCISSLERLFEMGAARSVLATSLLCILAQRLVGKLCDTCKHKTPQGYIARGCDACNGSGIKGRLVIAQALHINDSLRALFWDDDNSTQTDWRLRLRKALVASNLPTLKDDALQKLAYIDYREIALLE